MNGSMDNITIAPPEAENQEGLKTLMDVVMALMIVFVALALGCDMMLKSIVDTMRRPAGVIIGMLCQFFIMPAIGFGLAHAFSLGPATSIAVIIMASCPGGVASNVYAFLAGGDMVLSVCMTTCSTAISIGMMPLNLYIYTLEWQHDDIEIPFVQIILSLVCIIIPVAIGVTIKNKLPKVAVIVKRVGGIATAIVIITATILQRMLYGQDTFGTPLKIWMPAAIMPAAGFFLGYVIAYLCTMIRDRYLRRKNPSNSEPDTILGPPQRLTIAIETGCQNTVLAIGIVSLSFAEKHIPAMMPFLILFSIFFSVEGILMVLICRFPKLKALAVAGCKKLFAWSKMKSRNSVECATEVAVVTDKKELAENGKPKKRSSSKNLGLPEPTDNMPGVN